jgi:hypothetical protein
MTKEDRNWYVLVLVFTLPGIPSMIILALAWADLSWFLRACLVVGAIGLAISSISIIRQLRRF